MEVARTCLCDLLRSFLRMLGKFTVSGQRTVSLKWLSPSLPLKGFAMTLLIPQHLLLKLI